MKLETARIIMKAWVIFCILAITLVVILSNTCHSRNITDICYGHWETYIILNPFTSQQLAQFAKEHNAPVYFNTPFNSNENIRIIRLWICDEGITTFNK